MNSRNLLIALLLLTMKSYSQDYQGSVGIRGGVTGGITYKIILMEERAFEGILGFRKNGIQLTGLSINHQPVLFQYSDKIFAYYGLGMHVGYYGRGRCKNLSSKECSEQNYFSPNLGIDGIVGLEYRILKYPITAGLDYKPFIDIFGTNFFTSNFYDFALAVKYTF